MGRAVGCHWVHVANIGSPADLAQGRKAAVSPTPMGGVDACALDAVSSAI